MAMLVYQRVTSNGTSVRRGLWHTTFPDVPNSQTTSLPLCRARSLWPDWELGCSGWLEYAVFVCFCVQFIQFLGKHIYIYDICTSCIYSTYLVACAHYTYAYMYIYRDIFLYLQIYNVNFRFAHRYMYTVITYIHINVPVVTLEVKYMQKPYPAFLWSLPRNSSLTSYDL